MQLNEILEENSVKTISEKTNISEENLEALFNGEFDRLKKVKTMGFISIVEREFRADLSELRDQAKEYYKTHLEEDGVVLDVPVLESQKGKFSFMSFLTVMLLGAGVWYLFTQFDQAKLRELLPFGETKVTDTIKQSVDSNPDLSIEHAISQESDEQNESMGSKETTYESDNGTDTNQSN